RLELETIPFGPREVVAEAVRLLALRASQKGLNLTWHVAPDVPPVLMGDPGRLRRVLVNLMGNAIKFTEQGEVVVSVSKEPPAKSQSRKEEEGQKELEALSSSL